MLLEFSLLVAGFGLLIKGADWLVNGASSLARKAGIQELIIGLTVVAFGTSAPELVVNIISSTKGLGDLTISNVIGSNIFNLMLIIGISGIIYPLVVQNQTIWKEIPFSLLAAVLLFLLLQDQWFGAETNTISRLDSFILLSGFMIFMFYIFRSIKKNRKIPNVPSPQNAGSTWKLVVFIILGLAGLIIGSQLVVDNAVSVAQSFGVSDKVIGITIVSAGTSLPELVTSVVAARKKQTDIAVGNVIGSNIFNILLILGVSGIIHPVTIQSNFNMDTILLALTTLFLFTAMFTGKKYQLDRWEAGLLFLGYGGYLIWQLN